MRAVRVSPPGRPIGPRLRYMIFKRDGGACQLCGRTARSGALLDIDHKIPVAKGGSNEPDNLQVLCSLCNLGKGTEDL